MGRPERKPDVTARLRDAITSGQFMPNERLIEMELAAALGAGRAHVRAALAQLEHEGLVLREPNRGARVRLVGHDEAIEITQARAALERLAVRHAALRASDEDRAALAALLARMADAVESGDLIAYSNINGELHAEIQRIAGHKVAQKLLATLKSQLVRFQYRAILLPGRPRQSLAEHEEIVAAIRARDPERAERAMAEHLGRAIEALRRVIAVAKMGPP